MTNADERTSSRREAARVFVPGAPRRVAWWLSVFAVVLMAVASAAGLLLAGVYGSPTSTASMLRAYDLVTLVVVVPALGAALGGARRGSLLAVLVWVSMLAASVYTYAVYVFGAGFNDLFLVQVGVFSASLYGLVLTVASLDVADVGRRLARGGGQRVVAGLLGLLAVGLGGMWVYASLAFAVSGEIPAGSALVETEAMVHLGIVLDLSLLVPAYAAACVGIWRRRPWGFVVGAVVLISGVVHQIGYLLALPFQVAAGVPGATAFDPVEPVIAFVFLIGAAGLLAPLWRGQRPSFRSSPGRPS